MTLVQSFEKSGNLLFKYRGQIPILLFILAVPAIYFTDYSGFSNKLIFIVKATAILVCALGLAIRIYTVSTVADFTSGRNRKEQVAESLNTTGIYSIVRHPLYLGNYLMWSGLLIYIMNPGLFIIISLLFWIYYERIMFAEERFLEAKFGQEFLTWSSRVPAFIPSFKKYITSRHSFQAGKALKEYSGILAAVISFVIIQTLQDLCTNGKFVINYPAAITLLVTLLMVSVIKYFIYPEYQRRHGPLKSSTPGKSSVSVYTRKYSGNKIGKPFPAKNR